MQTNGTWTRAVRKVTVGMTSAVVVLLVGVYLASAPSAAFAFSQSSVQSLRITSNVDVVYGKVTDPHHHALAGYHAVLWHWHNGKRVTVASAKTSTRGLYRISISARKGTYYLKLATPTSSHSSNRKFSMRPKHAYRVSATYKKVTHSFAFLPLFWY